MLNLSLYTPIMFKVYDFRDAKCNFNQEKKYSKKNEFK
jgi:hypothetical protein